MQQSESSAEDTDFANLQGGKVYFMLSVNFLFRVLPLWQPLDLRWASS